MPPAAWESAYAGLVPRFSEWDSVQEITDQLIDLTLDFRQSGHPGGSRSKVHILVALTLSGLMRWDIRRPDKGSADRFVLAAGHTVPAVYALLAVYHEALRLRYAETGDARFAVKNPRRWALTWEDLLTFRRRGGLPGHAEFAGKSLLFKFNTGPSGHGFPAAVGMALALRRAEARGGRVFVLEGEGGATAGAFHEAANAAWGLGLDNLFLLLDWNDYGIDPRPCSSVVYGTPRDWLSSRGWRVAGADDGSAWPEVARALCQAVLEEPTGGRPAAVWFKTRKGRGYGKFDHQSHGLPHPRHSADFWETKRGFQERFGVRFAGFGEPAPEDPAAREERARSHFQTALEVLRRDAGLYRALADRLVEIGEQVGEEESPPRLFAGANPWRDSRLTDYRNYPPSIWFNPGEKVANKAGLARWGAWVNSWGRREFGRPLFLAFSADLAESTSISGFGEGSGQTPGFGAYTRDANPSGALFLQEITEFANAAIGAGLASVNFSRAPENEWDGFAAAHSSYGAFAYLQYGPMRLYSQMAQDADFQLGPILWVLGHSGPETAEDSRTHFGIFEPSVSQLFPEGAVVDLHPWEVNEVPVLIAAGLAGGAKILALHLTRPPMAVPDRAAAGLPPAFAAAAGAYVLRPYRGDLPPAGVVIVQGTTTTANLVGLFPELDRRGLNVKVVAAVSPQLFARLPENEREAVLTAAELGDAMGITNRSRASIAPWLASAVGLEYTLSADRTARWLTGGTVDEVIEEAGLDPPALLAGIERFVAERPRRLQMIRALAGGA